MTKSDKDGLGRPQISVANELWLILKGVLAGLWSIPYPSNKPSSLRKEFWARRVDTGEWVKVWVRPS